MPIKKRISFKRTATKDFKSENYTFESEKDFEKWADEQYKDESYRKIIGIININ